MRVELKIQTPIGTTYSMNVDIKITVSKLKEMIIGNQMINKSDLHLFFEDKEMKDSNEISDYLNANSRYNKIFIYQSNQKFFKPSEAPKIIEPPKPKVQEKVVLDHVDIHEGDPEDFEEKIANVVSIFPNKPQARIEELLRRYEYDENRVVNMLAAESSGHMPQRREQNNVQEQPPPPPPPPKIELTQEEEDVIQRLKNRFPNIREREIREIYLSCEKNEENTVGILNIS